MCMILIQQASGAAWKTVLHSPVVTRPLLPTSCQQTAYLVPNSSRYAIPLRCGSGDLSCCRHDCSSLWHLSLRSLFTLSSLCRPRVIASKLCSDPVRHFRGRQCSAANHETTNCKQCAELYYLGGKKLRRLRGLRRARCRNRGKIRTDGVLAAARRPRTFLCRQSRSRSRRW